LFSFPQFTSQSIGCSMISKAIHNNKERRG